jgi:hypothetical protein
MASAHLPGFIAAWRPDGFGEMRYKTTILAGRVDLGDAGIRVLGVVWLLVAIGFVVTAAGTFTSRSWWTVALVGVALASLGLSALEWPLARVGVAVNVAILAALFAGQRLGWLQPGT